MLSMYNNQKERGRSNTFLTACKYNDNSEKTQLFFLTKTIYDGPNRMWMCKTHLKDPNIDVNLQDKNKMTALMYACQNKNIKYIAILMSHPNIDVNLQDDNGNTALHWAIKTKKINLVRMLLV